jgi:hypothetical protein
MHMNYVFSRTVIARLTEYYTCAIAGYQTLIQRLYRMSTLSAGSAGQDGGRWVRLVYPSAGWCERLGEVHGFLQQALSLYQTTCCSPPLPSQLLLPVEQGSVLLDAELVCETYAGNDISPPLPPPLNPATKDSTDTVTKAKSSMSSASATRIASSGKLDSARKASSRTESADKLATAKPVSAEQVAVAAAKAVPLIKAPLTFSENVICVQWYRLVSPSGECVMPMLSGSVDEGSDGGDVVLMMYAVVRKVTKKRSRLGIVALPVSKVTQLHARYIEFRN